MEGDTFKKRHGTTDVGKIYEDLNIANVVFRSVLDNNVDNFTLSSNNEKFEDFDDIVIEVQSSDNIEKKYALQLKHNENDRALKLKDLTHGSGGFSIQKYVNSYTKISEFDESYKLIIFTNRTFDITNGTVIDFEKLGFSARIVKTESEVLFRTSEKNICYKFEIVQNNNENSLRITSLYKYFFENFYLYTDQADVHKTEKALSRQFQQFFQCSDLEFIKYCRFISKWSLQKGIKEKLNKIMMRRVIALNVLSPHIKTISFGCINNKMKFLQAAINTFRVTVASDKLLDSIRKLWGDIKCEVVDSIDKMNKIRKTYQLRIDYIENINSVQESVDLSKIFWLLNKTPLIVTDCKSIWKVINMCQTEKFIVVGPGILSTNFQNTPVLQNLSNFNFESKEYRNVTTEFAISLQEKEKISLQKLIESCKEIKEIITTDVLLEMSHHDVYNIGGYKETLPVPYIKRSLTSTVVDINYLNNINDSTVVLIECKNNLNICKYKLSNYNYVDKDVFLKEKKTVYASSDKLHIYLAKNECSYREFYKLCRLNEGFERYHHFTLTDDDNLEWIFSLGDRSELEPFFLKNYTTNEAKLYSKQLQNRVNLIVGEPGMGKSILLKSLKNNFHSDFLTIIMFAQDMTSLCKNLKNHRASEYLEIFEQFLLKTKLNGSNQKIAEIMVKYNKSAYMWDATDEISDKDVQIICDLILEISKKNITQWITCRPRLKNYLEGRFCIFSENLVQLDDEQQSLYLNERLSEKYPSEDNSEIVRNIKTLIKHDDVLGVPMQIFMLTELFRNNRHKYLKLFSKTFSITDLYQYFVEEKFNFFEKKSGNKNYQQKRIFNDNKTNAISQYQKAALKLLIPSILPNLSECNEYLENVMKQGDPIGILVSVSDENLPYFLHISFAEYFVASYFVTNHETITNFQIILFEKKCKNIRFYFDLIMARNSPAHVALLYKNTEQLKKYGAELEKQKDLGGRNVMHLAASWGQMYPLLPIKKNVMGSYIIDDYNADTCSVSSENTEYLKMLLSLSKLCDLRERDDILNFTPLAYAEKTNSSLEKIIILKASCDKVKLDDDDMGSILYYSAKFGYDFLLDSFKKIPFIKTKRNNSTLLHLSAGHATFVVKLLTYGTYKKAINYKNKQGETPFFIACKIGAYEAASLLKINGAIIESERNTQLFNACQLGHEKIVQLLINSGIKVNIVDRYNKTPLHYACEKGHSEIVRLLILFQADIDALDYCNKTPHHYACERGYDEITRILIDYKSQVNVADELGKTSLHYACEKGHKEIVKLLVESKVKVNVVDEDRRTPLHYACENGYVEIVKLLIESGVNVKAVDFCNRTALHHACEKGHLDVVDILIQSKAYQDAVDNFRRTPLHYACSGGFTTIVKLLIESGTNVNIIDKYNKTPLHYAHDNYHYDIIHLLLKANVKIDLIADISQEIVYYACIKGNKDVLEIMLGRKTNVNFANRNKQTPLIRACEMGHEQIVQLLLQCNANVNIADKWDEKTPLHYACEKGYEHIIKLLIKYEADVNVVDLDDKTPLHYACDRKHEKIVKILIKRERLNINASDIDQKTPLHYACKNESGEIVKLLLESGADVNVVDYYTLTPLHYACQNRQEQILKSLTKFKANVNATDKFRKTPLHYVTEKGIYQNVKLLIESNADFDIVDKMGKTPLHYACERGYYEIVKLLLKTGANAHVVDHYRRTSLHYACQQGNEKIVKLLIESETDVNATDQFNETPVHFASDEGHERIVNMLTEHGAKVNVAGYKDQTPLHYACERRHREIVKLLVDYKADVNSINNCKMTPLHYACQEGHEKICRLLIEAGGDVNALDQDRMTPLHYACSNGRERIAQLLVEFNANIHYADCNKKTPLYYACENGLEETVKLLIESGANIHSGDWFKRTPLHYACEHGHDAIVKMLIDLDVDVNSVDKYNETPLHFACDEGHDDVVKTLLRFKAKTNIEGFDKQTPLHYASQKGHATIVERLLKSKVHVNVVDRYNQTPLDYAYLHKHGRVVKLLTEAKAESTTSIFLLH